MLSSRRYIAIPPGATIKEQLIDKGMSQKEFAARMDLSEKHVSKLINGEVQLTPDVAVRLEIVLGASANFWNNLEAIYREKIIKANAENAMDADVKIAKQFPYSEMADYGWVPKTRNANEKAINLRKYFEVVELSLLESNQITRIACRRLAITKKSDLALIAWAQETKIRARSIITSSINLKDLAANISQIRSMTNDTPDKFATELRTLLSNDGIALVFLPHLNGSFLHGATFYDGNKIVLGITARGSDADRFWFSLFHELAHITLGHIGHENGTTDDDEHEADAWAKNMLIPQKDFNKFVLGGSYSRESIIRFAESIGISPGIVVGRLQNDGFIKHNMMNELKMHYTILPD